MNQKILSHSKITSASRRLKSRGKKIVFTNGTFDFLHLGHVTYLKQAKRLGDVLIVGVNSDRSVRNYKGVGRPINPERDRLGVLTALECVDYAVLFGEPTPLRLIKAIKPHVLVKGADWGRSQIVGAREVMSWRGKVRRIRLLKGRSTTNLIKRLYQFQSEALRSRNRRR